ncbi:hypothetical protein B0H15DRAFT_844271 [Mycena belliarum]|uniref:Uncharacterized protein n=1 Tax=Mycena belliarum TaxID=1033014 RepID=A0AAD6XQZ9_9AGAR|nr:hypothetical protein B0H15DRAFT_844271 [Mycena belliae]
MTEYDYSPEGRAQWQRTQDRIAHWVDDTEHCAPQFKSPFVPRSDMQNNESDRPRADSASPSHSSSSSRQRSSSHAHHTHVHSPLRSETAPQDSRSLTHTHRSHRERDRDQDRGRGRARSHSPSRHTSHRSSHRRSNSRRAYTIGPAASGVTVQYAQAVHSQPAAYVVIARGDRRVQVVYAQPPPHAEEDRHPSLLQRIFGSQSGKHGRSRSVGHSRG